MITFAVLSSVLGLMLFEIVSSVDNAVINAEVLRTLPAANRRWFLRWGLLFAVVGMRGLLPWIIVWLSIPTVGFLGAFTVGFTSDLQAGQDLHAAASNLILASGTSLLLVFLYWFVVEQHAKGSRLKRDLLVFLILGVALLLGFAYGTPGPPQFRPMFIGLLLFVVLLVTKRLASIPRQRMALGSARRAKMVYLEVLDSIFSIENVLAAFAFTISVPVIMVGSGLGSTVVRLVTTARSQEIHRLHFLKRGAMYAIGFLSVFMLLHGIGVNMPVWTTLATTLISMGLAFIQLGG